MNAMQANIQKEIREFSAEVKAESIRSRLHLTSRSLQNDLRLLVKDTEALLAVTEDAIHLNDIGARWMELKRRFELLKHQVEIEVDPTHRTRELPSTTDERHRLIDEMNTAYQELELMLRSGTDRLKELSRTHSREDPETLIEFQRVSGVLSHLHNIAMEYLLRVRGGMYLDE